MHEGGVYGLGDGLGSGLETPWMREGCMDWDMGGGLVSKLETKQVREVWTEVKDIFR